AAAAIGTAAYRDTGWIAATRAALPRRAAALDAMLARRGYTATGACPLFRLIETEGAGALFERLAHARILTRPFAERPDWLRLGLPADTDALARLEAALG
ncbi:MAG TPA: threonine-phosphate decarboxylase, partial [Sphingopyxis sp.]|nr:threonine-phosphate decarboxylase [Sphingopyxis sp.]